MYLGPAQVFYGQLRRVWVFDRVATRTTPGDACATRSIARSAGARNIFHLKRSSRIVLIHILVNVTYIWNYSTRYEQKLKFFYYNLSQGMILSYTEFDKGYQYSLDFKFNSDLLPVVKDWGVLRWTNRFPLSLRF
jgi:hypothetical protein